MDIAMLLSSLGAAKTLAGLLIDERDREKAATIKIDLTEKLIQAQAQVSEVLAAVISKDEAIRTLTERNTQLEAAQREKERYRLAKVGTVGEFFAYQLRPAAELVERADEPPHFVCQPCFDAGKKSVLRIGKLAARCSVCDVTVTVTAGPEVRPQRTVSRWMER